MPESLKAYLLNWNATTNERQKLQHTYIALTVAIVLIAGLISLIDPYTGHNVVLVGVFTTATFFANAIVWNLLQSGLLDKLAVKRKRK